MIRLYPASSNDDLRPSGLCFGQGKFQLANFITANRTTGHIIALNPDTRPTHFGRQALSQLQWRRGLSQL
jgi:hypothetical protein